MKQLEASILEFVAALRRAEKSDGTVNAYEYRASRFVVWLRARTEPGRALSLASLGDALSNYAADLTVADLSPRSIDSFIDGSSRFVRFLGGSYDPASRASARSSTPPPSARSRRARPPLPNPDEVARARERYLELEGRDVVYRVARDLIERANRREPGSFSRAEGVAVLLLSWNASFYRPRPRLIQTLVADLDLLIAEHEVALERYRTLDLRDADLALEHKTLNALYRAFVAVLWPVGTAKALHVLAPGFFPLWDRPIAQRLHLRLSPPEASIGSYLELMAIAQTFARSTAMADPLKALDEWAYVSFTVPRRRG